VETLNKQRKQLVMTNQLSENFPYEDLARKLIERDQTLTQQFTKAKLYSHGLNPPEDFWFSIMQEFDPGQLDRYRSRVPAIETKYFGEFVDLPTAALFKGDSRFFTKLQDEEIIPNLKLLFDAWTRLAAKHDITYWIAHGALIGWFWNQQMLPWDDDIDLQIPISSLVKLIELNQTLFDEGRYLLDVNPFCVTGRDTVWRSSRSPPNKIDARFIDTTNGMYIDITALSLVPKAVKHCLGSNFDSTKCELKVSCKTPHNYLLQDLFPLQITKLEQTITFRPAQTILILKQEYGEKAMITELFNTFYFFRSANEWRRLPPTVLHSNVINYDMGQSRDAMAQTNS